MDNGTEKARLREEIIKVLETCYDPEIPVNIYQLGLVYNIDINDAHEVDIQMTLTSPMCPVAGSLPIDVENKVKTIPGVKDARVQVVWEPQWHPGMMSDVAKFELGFL
ncbi:MAG: iron-sulfur cluster assembly protein [candidate division KSB1 bacterium]|nr:iron-sulfur cluster assembly protein [candidate division KSB1 bacterium]MDZ7275205.1 iron-sulfur cluster assembly protein [candidate division KSB1 bacterium]MDZ7287374.1 iron-sulfur cluster assembly protein [candidate division KSB1 bacterium]MDZ7299488.1 iron-sulfur cluster assembly protein [candidate division KSB1 bacterium]MDZ7305466.1 iron-sulfur cluster assembly protein [candidate division KSB1 bacterium]